MGQLAPLYDVISLVVFRDSNVKNLLDKKCNLDTLKISIQKESLFLGQGGDKIENLLWRIVYGRLPQSVQILIVHIGTNSLPIKDNKPADIAKGIVNICEKLYVTKCSASVIWTGILLGRGRLLWKVKALNRDVKTLLNGNKINTSFIVPDYEEWVLPNGELKAHMYPEDELHLSAKGYGAFIYYIQKISLISRHSLLPRSYLYHQKRFAQHAMRMPSVV